MVKGKEVSIEVQMLIFEDNKAVKHSKDVSAVFHLASHTLSAIYKQYQVSKVICKASRSGRLAPDDKAIIRTVKENPSLTAVDIHNDIVAIKV